MQEPDITLVEAAIDGDAESFTELCKRYYPAMVAIAHSILGDRDLAEDAAQEAFARAAVKLPQIKDCRKFAGWLAVICRNASRGLARHQNGRKFPDGYTGTVDKPERDDSKEAVKAALNKLSDSAKEIIYLRYYDGLSYEQISSVLGISEQAINGRIRRAKKKMAEHLRHQSFSEKKNERAERR